MVRKFGIAQRVLLVIGLVTIASLFPLSCVQAQQGGTNLLVNGDFEWWDPGASVWPFQDGISEVQVCPGWRAFYLDNPPSYAQVPNYWRRPEFRDVKAGEYAVRVRSGHLAAKYFSFAGQHEAGFYQQVDRITPGTPLRFSVYMQTWSCMPNPEAWNICPTKDKSNDPSPMHTRVGIDPTGGTNPWSPSVVWSPEIDAYDAWTYFQVEANAQNSTVTAFTYSRPDWTDTFFRVHNDVYVDDASLIALNEVLPTATPGPLAPTATLDPTQPTATPAPALPTVTPAPTATPSATSTPRPDGAVTYIVQEGDTLSAIARLYQVSIEKLLQLNGLTEANIILVGHELLLSVPEFTATPTPSPEPSPELPTPTALPPTPMEMLPMPTALLPTSTAIPSMATALPSPTAAVITIPLPTSEAEKNTPLWRLVSGIGIVLMVGIGVGFVFRRKR